MSFSDLPTEILPLIFAQCDADGMAMMLRSIPRVARAFWAELKMCGIQDMKIDGGWIIVIIAMYGISITFSHYITDLEICDGCFMIPINNNDCDCDECLVAIQGVLTIRGDLLIKYIAKIME